MSNYNTLRFQIVNVTAREGRKEYTLKNLKTGSIKTVDEELKSEYYKNGWL